MIFDFLYIILLYFFIGFTIYWFLLFWTDFPRWDTGMFLTSGGFSDFNVFFLRYSQIMPIVIKLELLKPIHRIIPWLVPVLGQIMDVHLFRRRWDAILWQEEGGVMEERCNPLRGVEMSFNMDLYISFKRVQHPLKKVLPFKRNVI